jgi:predicted RNA-binding Zn-ribbon protein involved in translation (DUF1610 family)
MPDDIPMIKCHWCGDQLHRHGRKAASYLPCCGEVECQRARKRRYEAEYRIRIREMAKASREETPRE